MNSILFYRCGGMEKLSESVFVGICQIVGTSLQIAIRRASCNISEMVERRVAAYNERITMVSESYREGFRMAGSDMISPMGKGLYGNFFTNQGFYGFILIFVRRLKL